MILPKDMKIHNVFIAHILIETFTLKTLQYNDVRQIFSAGRQFLLCHLTNIKSLIHKCIFQPISDLVLHRTFKTFNDLTL